MMQARPPSQLHLQVEHPHVGVQSGRQEPMKKAETAPCPQHCRCVVYGRFLSVPMEFICTNHRITHTTLISVNTRLLCAKKKNDSGRTESNKTTPNETPSQPQQHTRDGRHEQNRRKGVGDKHPMVSRQAGPKPNDGDSP